MIEALEIKITKKAVNIKKKHTNGQSFFLNIFAVLNKCDFDKECKIFILTINESTKNSNWNHKATYLLIVV